jgi:hypothetical protein
MSIDSTQRRITSSCSPPATRRARGAAGEAGTPKALFDTRIGTGTLNHFDVSQDGHFLIATQVEDVVDSPLTLIVNWLALLKK